MTSPVGITNLLEPKAPNPQQICHPEQATCLRQVKEGMNGRRVNRYAWSDCGEGSRPAFRLERSSPISSMVPGCVVEELVTFVGSRAAIPFRRLQISAAWPYAPVLETG